MVETPLHSATQSPLIVPQSLPRLGHRPTQLNENPHVSFRLMSWVVVVRLVVAVVCAPWVVVVRSLVVCAHWSVVLLAVVSVHWSVAQPDSLVALGHLEFSIAQDVALLCNHPSQYEPCVRLRGKRCSVLPLPTARV